MVGPGEAGFRLLCATKLGHELHDEQQDTEADVTWRADSPIMLAAEIATGLGEDAVGYYAIIAAAARAARGCSISADMAATAALYSESPKACCSLRTASPEESFTSTITGASSVYASMLASRRHSRAFP